MKTKQHVILLVSVLLVAATHVFTKQCRYASSTSLQQLIDDKVYRHNFIMNMTYWEGKFSVDGIGLNLKSGLTYDGHAIDYDSGLVHDPLHAFSAASKECIHLGLLASALSGNPYAINFMSSASEGDSQFKSVNDYVLSLLERKISNYEMFNKKYPGFGGYVSWYSIKNDQMDLLWDWTDRVPSLDNGELIWSMIAAAYALSESGQIDLATRYWNHVKLMAETSLNVFYSGEGCIRCVTKILNVTAAPTKDNFKSADFCCLDDPYEGELMAFFLDFYAPWGEAGYSDSEKDKIWSLKRAKLQKATFTSQQGPIDVEKGWWYSSHEKWKYMMMPYLDVPVNKRVFLNGERARVRFSYEKGFGGLFASVTNVSQAGNYEPNYISATGIQEIAFQYVVTNQLVTPYGAYPLLIDEETRPYGLAWYAAMLKGSKMQGPYGSTESVSIDGRMISPVNTWDSKITSVLAVCGGVVDLVRDALQKQGHYERFVALIQQEWGQLFNTLRGENIAFVAPGTSIPNVLPEFTGCNTRSNGNKRE